MKVVVACVLFLILLALMLGIAYKFYLMGEPILGMLVTSTCYYYKTINTKSTRMH